MCRAGESKQATVEIAHASPPASVNADVRQAYLWTDPRWIKSGRLLTSVTRS